MNPKATSYSFDRWLLEPELFISPVLETSKPWLKICLYVGGEKKGQGHKYLMLDHNTSLASVNSQVFNAYYRQLAATYQNLHEDSIRGYIVHYGGEGSGSVGRIAAWDDGAWAVALVRLLAAGERDQVVLKSCVDVHF
jgi:hypothetical protein